MKLLVREVAEARGFKNAKALADAISMSYSSIYPIWDGTAKRIDLATLDRLCKVLRVQAGLLFEQVPDTEPLPGSEPSRGVRAKSERVGSARRTKRESRKASAARAAARA